VFAVIDKIDTSPSWLRIRSCARAFRTCEQDPACTAALNARERTGSRGIFSSATSS
jgi:hypothetical protein